MIHETPHEIAGAINAIGERYVTPSEVTGATDRQIKSSIIDMGKAPISQRPETEALLNTLPLSEENRKIMQIIMDPKYTSLERESGEKNEAYLSRHIAYLMGMAVREPLRETMHQRLTPEEIQLMFPTFANNPVLVSDTCDEWEEVEEKTKRQVLQSIRERVRAGIEYLKYLGELGKQLGSRKQFKLGDVPT